MLNDLIRSLWFVLLGFILLATTQVAYPLENHPTRQEGEARATATASSVARGEQGAGRFSSWIAPNFVDTQYSALFSGLSASRLPAADPIYQAIPFGWFAYHVEARVIEVYKGELDLGAEIELLVYIPAMSTGPLKHLDDEFLLSFCQSQGGIYYTSRNFLIQAASEPNINKFRLLVTEGADFQGLGECASNYPSLNPDTHSHQGD